MTIRELGRRLLARVKRSPDRMYVLNITLARPVCLTTRGDEEAWRWHARLGHLNFLSLKKMVREEIVRGLPELTQVEQLSQACLAGKQRRTSFPDQAQYHTQCVLELVHGDICGKISPATPSGNQYFLCLWWMIRAGSCGLLYWRQRIRFQRRGDQTLPTLHGGGDRTEAWRAAHRPRWGIQLGGLPQVLSGPWRAAAIDGTPLTATKRCGGAPQRLGGGHCSKHAEGERAPKLVLGKAVTMAVYLLNRSPTKSVSRSRPGTGRSPPFITCACLAASST